MRVDPYSNGVIALQKRHAMQFLTLKEGKKKESASLVKFGLNELNRGGVSCPLFHPSLVTVQWRRRDGGDGVGGAGRDYRD